MRPVLILFFAVVALSCTKGSNKNTTPSPNPTDTTHVPSDTADTTDTTHVPLDTFKTYIIPAGANYMTGNTYPLFNGTFLHFKAILDSSCIYQTADPLNQADINKLFGISDCSSYHHVNSARFGWNWFQDSMRIHAYWYADSVRYYRQLGTVKIGVAFECRLDVAGGQYIFTLNGKHDTVNRGCAADSIHGYKLYPYFGGNEPAPQTIRIKILEMP